MIRSLSLSLSVITVRISSSTILPTGMPVQPETTSATDWLTENPEDTREGWTGEDTVRLAKELTAHGVDLLDVSTGGMVRDAKIVAGPNYQVPFAAQARNQAFNARGPAEAAAA